jgi:hypothetical protein
MKREPQGKPFPEHKPQQILLFVGGGNDGGAMEVYDLEPVQMYPRVTWESKSAMCFSDNHPMTIQHVYNMANHWTDSGVEIVKYVHAGYEVIA